MDVYFWALHDDAGNANGQKLRTNIPSTVYVCRQTLPSAVLTYTTFCYTYISKGIILNFPIKNVKQVFKTGAAYQLQEEKSILSAFCVGSGEINK